MAIKPSGPIGLGTDLPAEFGGTAPFSLSQYYRGGGRVPNAPQNAAVPTSGTISLGEFYNTINVLTLTISGTVSNYNLYNEFVAKYGTPTAAVPVRLDIDAGSVVGGVGTYALNIGQFPAGTTIDIYNNGQILAYGGGPNGGVGGDAVYAAYGGQTMRFYNQSGALCYGGGGGGGHGGTGGTGGGGSYDVITNKGAGRCYYQCGQTPGGEGTCDAYGPTAFCNSGCTTCNPVLSTSQCNSCATKSTGYSSGGGGGGGGNGGVGRGFNQSNTAGDPGAGGAAGGTNAGTGGTGGHGGAGGDWGTGGNTGDQGGTGANGNNGTGQAGTSGSGGGSGGRYYVRGGADFTFTNNGGTTAGGTA